MRGIDISQHNGDINFDELKSQVDFAILRIGWIGNHNNHTLDTKFWEYYHECNRVGIPVGGYVFCYAKSEEASRSGAEWVLSFLEKGDLELPIYIDMENDDSSSFKLSSLGKRKLTDIAKAFNEVIESGGIWAGVYANLDWWRNYLIEDELNPRFTTWIAHYGVNINKYEGQYDMLQYTSSGRVDGINTNVDMNEMYRNLLEEIKPGNNPQPTPAPIQKSNDEIADEVIQGLWGNGEDRKQRLQNAGYDYNEVQSIVNEKLGYSTYYSACSPDECSIVDGLKSIGVDSSFDNRKNIAIANGIYNYTGTSNQNERLLVKLRAGKLKKA